MGTGITEDETLTAGLMREVLDDGKIIIFTLTDMTRDTVDAWVDGCIDAMRKCSEEKRPLLIVQDLSDPNISQTPYSKQRGAETTDAYPDVFGRIAFILPETVLADPIRKFMRSQPNQSRNRDAFHTREEALAWLRELSRL